MKIDANYFDKFLEGKSLNRRNLRSISQVIIDDISKKIHFKDACLLAKLLKDIFIIRAFKLNGNFSFSSVNIFTISFFLIK